MTTPDKIIIDPRIRDFLPPLTAEQVAGLERNILADGRLTSSLVVWKGRDVLIDGHHRHAIATKHGLPVTVEEVELADLPAVFAWMLDRQEYQRAWTPYLRSESALKMKAAVAEENAARRTAAPREAQREASESVPPNLGERDSERKKRETDAVVAKAAKVSPGTVRSVEKIQTSAVPELQELAKTSAVAVDAAAQVASLPKDEQQKVVAGGAAAVKAKAAEIRNATRASKAASLTTGSATVEKPATPPPPRVDLPPEEMQIKRFKDFLPSTRKAPRVDQLGQKLPDEGDVLVAFDGASDFDHAVHVIGALKSHLLRLGPAAKMARPDEMEVLARNWQVYLKTIRPFAVCPECRGTGIKAGHECVRCRGRKWITKGEHDLLPSELKGAQS